MCMQYVFGWPVCIYNGVYTLVYMFSQLYKGVKPTLGELEKFESTPDEVELNGKKSNHSIIMYTGTYVYDITVTSSGDDSKTGPILAPGDIVEVYEGQLMYLQGKVINQNMKISRYCTYVYAYTYTSIHYVLRLKQI